MTELRFTIPLRIQSAANLREHWRTKARRVSRERLVVAAYGLLHQWPRLEDGQAVVVSMTRVAPRALDGHDNLRHALKPVADELARLLRVDDRDPRVTWAYEQRKGRVREYAVVVEVTAGEAPRA